MWRRPLNLLAIVAIRLYQLTLSKYLAKKGVSCLHYPTCSRYGMLAYQKYPFFKASDATWRRYRDCHPFSGRPYIDYP